MDQFRQPFAMRQQPVTEEDLIVEDAMAFTEQIKHEFREYPNYYMEFVYIMKQYRAGQLDTAAMAARIIHLFQGHPNLTARFNNFLPNLPHISMRRGTNAHSSTFKPPVNTPVAFEPTNQNAEKHSQSSARVKQKSDNVTVYDALQYLDAVKLEFRDSPETYNEFIRTVKAFRMGLISTQAVIFQVITLFKGRQHLINGLNRFLPDSIRYLNPEIFEPQDIPDHEQKLPIGGNQRPAYDFGSTNMPISAQIYSHIEPNLDPDNPNPPRRFTPNNMQHFSEFGGQHLQQAGMVHNEANMSRNSPKTCMNPKLQSRFFHFQTKIAILADVAVMDNDRVLIDSKQYFDCKAEKNDDIISDIAEGCADKDGDQSIGNACHYLHQVRDRFSANPLVYREFLELINIYKQRSVRSDVVIERICHMFEDNEDLILKFNILLPDSLHITKSKIHEIKMKREKLNHKIPRGPPQFFFENGENSNNVTASNSAFNNSRHSHKNVSNGPPMLVNHPWHMSSIRPQPNKEPVSLVREQIGVESVPNSNDFPPNYQAPIHKLDDAVNYIAKVKSRFGEGSVQYETFVRCLSLYEEEKKELEEVLNIVLELFFDQSDLLIEFSAFIPDDPMTVELKRRVEIAATACKNQAKKLNIVEPKFEKDMPEKKGTRAASLKKLAPKPSIILGNKQKLNAVEVVEIFSDKNSNDGSLVVEKVHMKTMDSKGYNDSEDEEKMEIEDSNALLDESINSQTEISKSHKKCLKKWSKNALQGISPTKERISNKEEQFAKSNIERLLSAPSNGSSVSGLEFHSHSEQLFFDALKQKLGSDNWLEFIKLLRLYAIDLYSISDIFDTTRDMLLTVEVFDVDIILDELGCVLRMQYLYPISKSNLKKSRACTPSYRVIPQKLMQTLPECTGQTKIDKSVLNQRFVSVPIGSENFAHLERTPAEQALFKIEDERFEIDVMINTLTSAQQKLEFIAHEMSMFCDAVNDSVPDMSIEYKLDNRALGINHKRAILNLYGEQGEKMLEYLFKIPSTAVPIILGRMKQKISEWKKAKKELEHGWAESAKKLNLSKALDYTVIQFKENDPLTWSDKNLTREVRNSEKKNQTVTSFFEIRILSSTSTLNLEHVYKIHTEALGLLRMILQTKYGARSGNSRVGLESWEFLARVISRLFSVEVFGRESGEISAVFRPNSEDKFENSNFRTLAMTKEGFLTVRLYTIMIMRLLRGFQLLNANINVLTWWLPFLYTWLSGTITSNVFEDACRREMGNDSYIFSTADLLVQSLISNLQSASNDNVSQKLLDLELNCLSMTDHSSYEFYTKEVGKYLKSQNIAVEEIFVLQNENNDNFPILRVQIIGQ